MSISPSTVFHFTSKKGLEGILSDNFKLKYCVEKLNHSTRPVEVAIPMVSFCDIKISEITEHIEKYGHYGIGLSKEWAVEKGLNPVVYLNSSSKFAADLITHPSVTPKDEGALDRLEKQLSALGFRCRRYPFGSGKVNLYCQKPPMPDLFVYSLPLYFENKYFISSRYSTLASFFFWTILSIDMIVNHCYWLPLKNFYTFFLLTRTF